MSKILGFHFPQDRWHLLKGPDFEAKIADYNWELTGYDERLEKLDPKTFTYGGNAYYILTYWIKERGWTVEELPRQVVR